MSREDGLLMGYCIYLENTSECIMTCRESDRTSNVMQTWRCPSLDFICNQCAESRSTE